jgi:hypothetical protein
VKISPPKAEEVIQLVAETKFLAHAARTATVAEKAINDIKRCVEDPTENRVRSLTEVDLEVANAWNEAARIVRSEVAVQRGHLSVVKQ